MCYIWWAHVKVMKSNQEFFFFFWVENTKYFNTQTHMGRGDNVLKKLSTMYIQKGLNPIKS